MCLARYFSVSEFHDTHGKETLAAVVNHVLAHPELTFPHDPPDGKLGWQSQRKLSRESQALLLKLMTEAIPGAKRLKGELPAGTVVAHKTGTGGTRNGITSATNDIGIITLPDGRHLAVAAFVSDSAANDDTRDAIVARLAKAAWDRAYSLGR